MASTMCGTNGNCLKPNENEGVRHLLHYCGANITNKMKVCPRCNRCLGCTKLTFKLKK